MADKCDYCGDERPKIPKRRVTMMVTRQVVVRCENIRACNTRKIKNRRAS